MTPTLPSHVARLFGHYDPAVLRRPDSRLFLALRLAEEGDRRDLRWLVEAVGETELAALLGPHAGVQLTPRSRAFWQLILNLPPATSSPTDTAIWSP